MQIKSVTYTWQEADDAVADENGLVEIHIEAGDQIEAYVVAVPDNDRDKASTVAQVWDLHGKP
jgi:hypothetical protein